MADQPATPRPPDAAAVDDQAAHWLARRDRGLSAAEQDLYLQWLAADPRHGEAMARHADAFERMMQLYECQPSHAPDADPDLFAPRRRPSRWLWPLALAAAAALVLGVGPRFWSPAPATAPHLRVNERVALPDGSRVELKDGSHIGVAYSDTERRVQLTGGEAQFNVWKDATRPFIVAAGGVEVRAVGTVFNVRLAPEAVEVLVTEGRVKVNRAAGPGGAGAADAPVTFVSAGEQAVLRRAGGASPQVTAVSADDIRQALAWQAPRLQFSETPLGEAVAEFNRLNHHQLVLGDPELANLAIGGTFRPDNVDGFVRLLCTTLDLRAEAGGEGRTILRRR